MPQGDSRPDVDQRRTALRRRRQLRADAAALVVAVDKRLGREPDPRYVRIATGADR